MVDLSLIDKTPGLDLEERIVHDLEQSDFTMDDKKLRMVVQKEKIFCQAAVDFTKFCKLPKPGEQFRIVTNKPWNGYTLIKRILATGAIIEELYLAVYSINDVAARGLMKAYEGGQIKAGWFIVSDLFWKYRNKEAHQVYRIFRQFCHGTDVLHHGYMDNHAKVTCIKDNLGNYLVMEGSGNLSDNAKIEQLLFENNKVSFDFHSGWIRDAATAHEKKNLI